jgi:SPP1 gp7 family putative phage head morphogenesis protein
MEFIQSKKLTREDILSVFGVPPIMAGVLEYSNYSVAKQQREIFWRDTMMPILSAYIDVLNYSFVKVLDETLELKCDYTNIPELQDDQKLVAETDEIYTRSGVKTINEVRERLGLEPVPYGNTWNVGLGIAPIGGSSIPPIAPEPNKVDATNEEMPKPKSISCGDPEQYMPKLNTWTKRATLLEREVNHKQLKEQILKMATDIHEEINLQLRAKDFVKALDNGASISKEAKRYSLWVEFKDFTEEKEKHFMVGLRKEFNKQHEEVLNNIEKVSWPKILQLMRFCKKNEEDDKIRRILFNDSEAIKRSRELGNEEITNILKENAIKELEKLNPGISFDVTNPKVAKWIDEKAFKFAKEITDTTQDKLRKTLKEAIDEGESIDQVEKRIGDVFDIAVGSRTEMIARTETISASNAGSLAAYEQSGVVEKKEWLATQDDRTRESHLAVDGETVGIDERFSNGLLFPGDPSGSADEVIQCRCTLLASQITEQE